jgi:arylsulfatase A-like enzyme/Tfp pilus assembly protein PilF
VKRSIAVAVLALWGACRGGPRATAEAIAPGALRGSNVLLVTIDTLRADRVGAYGSPLGLTPTLDRLSREGLKFDVVYAHVPLTLPSHTTIMTGVYPFTSGVRDNGSFRFDGARPTIASALRAAGYRTAAFVGAFPVDARFGLNAGFDVYDDNYGSRPAGGELSVLERPAEQVLAPAYDWIANSANREPRTANPEPKNQNQNQNQNPNPERRTPNPEPRPWFAWVHLYDPHDPYEPPEPYRSRYAADPYAGEVAYADAALGGFLDRLRSAGALDRTLIVMAADHGESLGEHGERTHGLFAYNATLRVPLIVWAPPIVRPGVVSAPARLVDVMPTLLDLVGVDAGRAVDGRSVRPGAQAPAADTGSYFEALNANLSRNWAPLTGIVQSGVKLIDLPVPELYDLGGDPSEQQNIYARRTDLAKPLEQRLDALTARAAKPAAASVDAETARRLQSLGYIVSSAPRPARTFTARDDPKNLIGLQNRLDAALDALKRDDAATAEQLLRSIVGERGDFTVASERLAFLYHETGQLPRAIVTLEAAAKASPGDAELLATLGEYLQQAGDLDRSAAVLETAIRVNAAAIDAHEKLGVTYTRMRRFGDAEREFRAVLASDPSSPTTYNNLGSMYLSANRNDAAIDALTRAIALDPRLANAHNGLGVAYARAHNLDKAAEEWREALRLRPDLADARANLQQIAARGAIKN